MKISTSIREVYKRQYDIHLKLKERIDTVLGDSNDGRWFYKSRIKSEESYTQKIETGRFEPDSLEDYFACTIVVENRTAINEARLTVEKYCDIIHRRPKEEGRTHKLPEAFSFDDLRLFVKLKTSISAPSSDLNEIIFEVQIKTFLQHAWSIATHDLIYKGDSVSWAKARLAYQIKAMLEHAEVSIEQVNEISKSSGLALIDVRTEYLLKVISWISDTWTSDFLPKDIVRLGNTIIDLLSATKVTLEDLQDAVKKDTDLGLGSNSRNLSPYEIILKSLINHQRAKLISTFTSSRNRCRILVTPELEIDDFISAISENHIIRLGFRNNIEPNISMVLTPPDVHNLFSRGSNFKLKEIIKGILLLIFF